MVLLPDLCGVETQVASTRQHTGLKSCSFFFHGSSAALHGVKWRYCMGYLKESPNASLFQKPVSHSQFASYPFYSSYTRPFDTGIGVS
jgi:hypothetical protein